MGTLNLYEKDFYAWTKEQANLIKEKALDKLDLANLFRTIAKRLNKMPSLNSKLLELYVEVYDDAIFEAEKKLDWMKLFFLNNALGV